jgi:hypothetical protein
MLIITIHLKNIIIDPLSKIDLLFIPAEKPTQHFAADFPLTPYNHRPILSSTESEVLNLVLLISVGEGVKGTSSSVIL